MKGASIRAEKGKNLDKISTSNLMNIDEIMKEAQKSEPAKAAKDFYNM